MARILIVDDQMNVLTLLEGILASKNHVVTSCTNSIDAYAKLTSEKFDLVITDAMMPGGGSGYDLTRTIRNDSTLEGMPIIILTGKREPRDVQKALDAGVDDYMVKPVDPDILHAKIESLLTKKNKDALQFSEVAVRYSAEYDVKTDIVAISEVGMTIHTPLSALVGTKIKIKSEIFDEIGIMPPVLRVVECKAPSAPNTHFTWTVHFVGLSEREYQPIRIWVRTLQRPSVA